MKFSHKLRYFVQEYVMMLVSTRSPQLHRKCFILGYVDSMGQLMQLLRIVVIIQTMPLTVILVIVNMN